MPAAADRRTRVLASPEVFEVHGSDGRPALIEVPAGTRVSFRVTELPSFEGLPDPAELAAA